MKKSIRPLALLFAVIAGVGAFSMTAPAATLVPICFQGRVVGVQSYLVPRYIALGASLITNPCPNS